MDYLKTCLGAALFAWLPLCLAQGGSLQAEPAAVAANAPQAMMLAATRAQARLVAVGDHGMVLLSDDQGRSFRQASAVPLSTALTGVSFVDARHGWAVGQWGAILATTDGGEHWSLQRLASEQDRPLFAVHFFDARHGVAVGLWSLVLTTGDGGANWTEQTLPAPPGAKRADLNLIGLFADGHGRLYATAERGQLLRSDDQGLTWRYLDSGYEGSLWAGAVLPDGRLLVGGQRGTLLRGAADGTAWERIPLRSRSSVTGIQVQGQQVLVVGLDGLRVESQDGGDTFEEQRGADSVSLTTALIGEQGEPVLFSRRGVVPPAH